MTMYRNPGRGPILRIGQNAYLKLIVYPPLERPRIANSEVYYWHMKQELSHLSSTSENCLSQEGVPSINITSSEKSVGQNL